MAETLLNVQTVGKAGTALSFANADTVNGNKFPNDGRTYIELWNNGSTGSATVTIATGAVVGGYAVADQQISLSIGQIKKAGPFDPAIFNNSNGDITMTITGTGAADVDIAVFK